jgi:hypothetical protein
MIKVYDADKLLADVELIDGKLHVIDYDEGDTSQFILEDLRRRQSSQNAVKKALSMGIKKFPPPSEWEPVSDQELYDSFPKHLGGLMWVERDDYETIEKLTRR